MPPTMHAHMPAIEIAFGETFREASQAVDDLRPFSIARRDGTAVNCFAGCFLHHSCWQPIAGRHGNGQNKIVTQTVLFARVQISAVAPELADKIVCIT